MIAPGLSHTLKPTPIFMNSLARSIVYYTHFESEYREGAEESFMSAGMEDVARHVIRVLCTGSAAAGAGLLRQDYALRRG